MHRCLILVGLVFMLFVTSCLFSRDLIVVNGLGETADQIDLDSGTIDLSAATLGITPNDFLVHGGIGVAINSGSNDLYFYNLPAMTDAGTLWLGNGHNPWSGAWLDSDTLVITNWLTSTLSLVDVPGRSVIAEKPIGVAAESINHPQSIVIVDRKAYVTMSCFDDLYQYHPGKIEVYDLNLDSTVARIDVSLNPQDITLGQDGYLYAVCTGNYFDVFGKLYRIDPSTDQVTDSLAIGGQPASVATTEQGVLYLGAGGWAAAASRPYWLNPRALPKWGTATIGGSGLVFTVDLAGWQLLHGALNPLHCDNGVVNVTTVSDSSVMVCCFQDDRVTEIDSSGAVLSSFATGDGPTAIGKSPECFVPRGDANGDGTANITDAVHMIQWIFAGGSPPISLIAGDSNGDGTANITDAVVLIQFIFAGGTPPQGCSD